MTLARESLENKFLYKYRSIPKDPSDQTKYNEDKLHYIQRMFTQNELHFPSPIDLNDPLECRPLITLGDLSDQQYKEKYVSFARRMMIAGGNQAPPDDITEWLEGHSQEEAKGLCKEHTEGYRLSLGKYRICSFSATNNNPLIWSHYSDSHQGFCLIFDADNDLFGKALKVEYQDDYPRLDFTEEDDLKVLKKSMLVKFSDWAYEKEYRLCSAEPNFIGALPVENNKWVFPKEMLKGIIFGCKMSDTDRGLLMDMCQDYSNDFCFKKAELYDNSFFLNIVDA